MMGQAQPRQAPTAVSIESVPPWDADALRRRWSRVYQPNPLIYWPDMIGSTLLGWSAYVVAASGRYGLTVSLIAFVVATFALYRAALFIHELSHLKRGDLTGFGTVWNLVVGIPITVPSLTYISSHREHHKRSVFGTPQDPEYQPIAHWRPWRIIASGLPLLFVPALLLLRWGVLGPLSYLIPPLRRVVVGHVSTLVINPAYRRRMPRGRDKVRWALEETGAAIFVWSATASVFFGWLSLRWFAVWYAVAAGILLMNHMRTLAAHRYENEKWPMDLTGQYLDSVNLSAGSWITALAAPVGLRYHALHHLLPMVPYHALGTIHRALMAEMPSDSWYRAADGGGIVDTTRGLLRKAVARKRDQPHTPPDPRRAAA